jgi:hypothetical protein
MCLSMKRETSKEARGACGKVATACHIKFDFLQVAGNFLSKKCNGLFARDSRF